MDSISGSPRFRVLGPLELHGRDGTPLSLGGRKARELLAFLLLNRSRTVSVGRLIDALWGDAATPGAAITLRTHVTHVRRALAEAGAGNSLVTRPGGYVLTVDADDVDAEIFGRLLECGQEELGLGDPERAAGSLGAALALWRGELLSDLGGPEFAEADAARLAELRLVAEEIAVDCELALGRHTEAVGRVQSLVATHPFRERFTAQLVIALYRSGRQADALAAYAATAERLADELGIDPGPDLRRLETAVLRQDPVLLGGVSTARATGEIARPPQASPHPPDAVLDSLLRTAMVGREAQSARLKELWRSVTGGGSAVALLSGAAGVGKSRLMAELARQATTDGATILVGRCDELSVPYQPMASVLGNSGTVAAVLGSAPGSVRGGLRPLLLDIEQPAEPPNRHPNSGSPFQRGQLADRSGCRAVTVAARRRRRRGH